MAGWPAGYSAQNPFQRVTFSEWQRLKAEIDKGDVKLMREKLYKGEIARKNFLVNMLVSAELIPQVTFGCDFDKSAT